VQRSIYDEVVDRIVGTVREITVGDRLDAGSGMGPLSQRGLVHEDPRRIERARPTARHPVVGGGRPGG
jgi:acyl-CoA reductase-like NAD-dependent aldehyde dehydrogenase